VSREERRIDGDGVRGEKMREEEADTVCRPFSRVSPPAVSPAFPPLLRGGTFSLSSIGILFACGLVTQRQGGGRRVGEVR